ncbi:hypothetical protein Tco_1189982, partial [Tanacetum coccineum]
AAARHVEPALSRDDLYRFVDMVDATPGRPMSRERVTELSTTVEDETHEMHVRFEDAQDDRALLRGRVNRLFRDRKFHHHIARLMEEEARVSHAAWAQLIDASNMACSEVISLRTTVLA